MVCLFQGAVKLAHWGCGAFGQAGVFSLCQADQRHSTGKTELHMSHCNKSCEGWLFLDCNSLRRCWIKTQWSRSWWVKAAGRTAWWAECALRSVWTGNIRGNRLRASSAASSKLVAGGPKVQSISDKFPLVLLAGLYLCNTVWNWFYLLQTKLYHRALADSMNYELVFFRGFYVLSGEQCWFRAALTSEGPSPQRGRPLSSAAWHRRIWCSVWKCLARMTQWALSSVGHYG